VWLTRRSLGSGSPQEIAQLKRRNTVATEYLDEVGLLLHAARARGLQRTLSDLPDSAHGARPRAASPLAKAGPSTRSEASRTLSLAAAGPLRPPRPAPRRPRWSTTPTAATLQICRPLAVSFPPLSEPQQPWARPAAVLRTGVCFEKVFWWPSLHGSNWCCTHVWWNRWRCSDAREPRHEEG